MAAFTITRPEVFPSGTQVSAYPRGALPPGASAPSGSAVETQPAGAAQVAFQNLADDREYIAAAQVNGVWRMVMFRTDPPPGPAGVAEVASVADAVVFVSSNGGNDANDGRSEGTAKATIPAAIAAIPVGARGRIRFLPGSTFTISSTITVRSDLDFELNDCLIQRSALFPSGDLFASSTPVQRVKFRGGRWDNLFSTYQGVDLANGSSEFEFVHNRVSNHSSTFVNLNAGALMNSSVRIADNDFLGDPNAENQNTVTVWNPYRCRITNNDFIQTGGCTASTSSSCPSVSRHVKINGNTFVGFNGSAILVRTSSNTTMEDVVVAGNSGETLGDTSHLKGLVVVGEAVVTGTPGTTRRATISGNTVKDFYGNGISCGGGSDGPTVEDFTIYGNVIDAAPVKWAASVTYSVGNVVSYGGSTYRRLVAGTTATAPDTDATNWTLITADPMDTTRGTTGIQLSGVWGFSISECTVRNCGRGGIRLLPGSNNAGCRRGEIAGCYVDSCVANPNITAPTADQEAGILLWDKCTDISIHDNTVRNTTTVLNGGTGIGAGAYVGINGIAIHDNRCFDDRTPKLQEYGVRIGGAGGDAAQPTDFNVHDNDLRGNLTQGLKTFNTTPKNYVFHHNKGITGLPESPLNADPLRRATVTSSTTLATSAELAGVTDNSASRTITLPLISAVPIGRVVVVKDETGTAATRAITVAGQGTDTIEGAATKSINTNYGSLRMYSNGTQWMVL